MSGALPTSPAFASLEIVSNRPTIVTRAISGKRQARQVAGQYWMLRASYPPMTRLDFGAVYGFLMSQRGALDTFTVQLPILDDPAGGTSIGSPLVNGASQTGRTLNADGFTASVTGILKAGDYLKFANHTKVYMITADVTSNGSGEASITLEPALLTSPATDSAITAVNVSFTVAQLGDVQSAKVSNSPYFHFSVDMEEVI